VPWSFLFYVTPTNPRDGVDYARVKMSVQTSASRPVASETKP
jgi:hypothetical protein